MIAGTKPKRASIMGLRSLVRRSKETKGETRSKRMSLLFPSKIETPNTQISQPVTVQQTIDEAHAQGKDETKQLPDEILLQIFGFIRDIKGSSDHSQTPEGDLASAVQTCRRWCQVGMPLLYQHFVLDVNYFDTGDFRYWERTPNNESIPKPRYNFIPSARFYHAASNLWSQPWTYTGIGFWIISFSIEVHFEQEEKSRTESVSKVLDVLPNVKILSIRAAPLKQDNFLERELLISLIESIPPKIENFELDLQHRDISRHGATRTESFFCSALASLLPQLVTLRLRMASLCPELVQSIYRPAHNCTDTKAYPKLHSISLNVGIPGQNPLPKCCKPEQWNAEVPPSYRLMDFLLDDIASRKAFPNLRYCALVWLRKDQAAPGTPKQRMICKTLDARLGTWTTARYLPFESPHIPTKYLRTDAEGDESERILRDLTIDELRLAWEGWIEHGQQTDELFEGDAGWSTDACGARHPPRV